MPAPLTDERLALSEILEAVAFSTWLPTGHTRPDAVSERRDDHPTLAGIDVSPNG
jgi:hypothetical protein